MTSRVFPLPDMSTELKSTDFHFQNVGKTMGFRSKTLHKHIYENCKINFFSDSRFLRLFLYFRYETRILKE